MIMMTLGRPVFWLVFFYSFNTTVFSEAKCSTKTLFQCPNLEECPDSGFSWVENCLDCPGYLSAYVDQRLCFDRRLLSRDNPNPSYLYRDIVGIIVWFVTAGLATACGVGGGGIYVPLGILLLAFAPKPSSGLSQASIFGASLGGLILNLQAKHPFTYEVARQITNETTNNEQEEEEGKYVDPSNCHQENLIGTETISSVPTVDETIFHTETCRFYTRPLIDYNMALFLAPMEMAGAVLGVLIQSILPNWLYLMVAAVILGCTAYKTYGKWWDIEKRESFIANSGEQHFGSALVTDRDEQDLQHVQETSCSGLALACSDNTLQASSTYSNQPLEDASPTVELIYPHEEDSGHLSSAFIEGIREADDHCRRDYEKRPPEHTQEEEIVDMDDDKFARRNELLQRDAKQYPADKLFVFCVLWAGLSLLTFLIGGKGVDSIVGITCADPWYGVLVATQFLWTLGFAAFFGWKLMKDTEEKKAVGYPFHPSDLLWDFPKTRFYAFYTFVAGVVAGLIGIGGGMILGPLMLVMGVHPRVSTATTATMIVLTSSSVAILFVTSGLVPWQYAVCFFCTCFVGAYFGKIYIDGYVKRTGKTSLLILLLATIIALATVGTLVIVLLRLAEADWCFAGFNQFCTVSTYEEEVTCASARMLHDGFYSHVIGASL